MSLLMMQTGPSQHVLARQHNHRLHYYLFTHSCMPNTVHVKACVLHSADLLVHSSWHPCTCILTQGLLLPCVWEMQWKDVGVCTASLHMACIQRTVITVITLSWLAVTVSVLLCMHAYCAVAATVSAQAKAALHARASQGTSNVDNAFSSNHLQVKLLALLILEGHHPAALLQSSHLSLSITSALPTGLMLSGRQMIAQPTRAKHRATGIFETAT
jgi:hypothetical protein